MLAAILCVSLMLAIGTLVPVNAQTSDDVMSQIGQTYQTATDSAISRYCKSATGLSCVEYQNRVHTSGCLPQGSQAVVIYTYISKAAQNRENLDDAADIIGRGSDYPDIAALAERDIKGHHPVGTRAFALRVLATCLDGIGVPLNG